MAAAVDIAKEHGVADCVMIVDVGGRTGPQHTSCDQLGAGRRSGRLEVDLQRFEKPSHEMIGPD